MRRNCILGALVLALLLSACSFSEPVPEGGRETATGFLEPLAPGEAVAGNDFAALDYSNTDQGYIQVRYDGPAQRAKVQILDPEGLTYTYTVYPGHQGFLPLTSGQGTYTVTVLENAFDNIYAVAFKAEVEAELTDEFLPYLYPNQYVWYSADSEVVSLGREISDRSTDDITYVQNVYEYVTGNITYDYALAANVPVDYLPDPDRTIETGTGICLDYASLMTALLRSQGVPAKLVVGWSGTQYHAWISVYLEETGWVDGAFFFDGVSWSRLDPTLAAGNRSTSVKDYVNNNANYKERFFY